MKKTISFFLSAILGFSIFSTSVLASDNVHQKVDYSKLKSSEEIYLLAHDGILINDTNTSTYKSIEKINDEFYVETVTVDQIQNKSFSTRGMVENRSATTYATVYRSTSSNSTDNSVTMRTTVVVNYQENSYDSGTGSLITSTSANVQRLDSSFRATKLYIYTGSQGAGYKNGKRTPYINEFKERTVNSPSNGLNYSLTTNNSGYLITGSQGVNVTTSFQRNTGGTINSFVVQCTTRS